MEHLQSEEPFSSDLYFSAQELRLLPPLPDSFFTHNRVEIWCTIEPGFGKAMKSSPILGPFCGSEFWGFSLLKI